MFVAKKIAEISAHLKKERISQRRIAFVPTMGALHDGHLELVNKAREVADVVVVSIFVNKTQFNDTNDYQKYPRQNSTDLNKLESCKVDYVFLPEDHEIFPADFSHKIIPLALTDCLCGSSRAGHFEGVALIITKLFNIIKPDLALFGEKDFQQVAIIKKLVSDLNFDVEIFTYPTVREASGLAMSSRNQRLSENAKAQAAIIFAVLNEIKTALKNSPADIENILQEKRQKLLNHGFEKVDYLEVRNEKNLTLTDLLKNDESYRVFVAAHIEGVRLIDNLKI